MGWPVGEEMPPALLAAISEAAGEAPFAAIQSHACFALDEARRRQTDAKFAVEAAAASHAKRKTAATEAALAQKKTLLLDAEGDVTAAEALCSSQPLSYAFITFKTSTAKDKVLQAASEGTLLLPELSLPSLKVHPAPNPHDVIWRSLENTKADRDRANWAFWLIMSPLSAVCCGIFAVAACYSALLDVNTGLTELLVGRIDKRLGFFLIIVTIYAIVLNLIIQPVFCVFADRGLFCSPKLRLLSCTYTGLHAKMGNFWMWIECTTEPHHAVPTAPSALVQFGAPLTPLHNAFARAAGS